jgi:cytosine deaminase
LRACRLAIDAAELDSHGVGAALFDRDGQIIVEGRNEVHAGRFRSDLHAEMVVMNRYEELGRHRSEARNHTLVTSLEPCPMCMARLIVAGVGAVLYVAADAVGGMVQRRRALPPTFRALIHSEGQDWRSADCSEELRTAAFEIWSASRERLNTQLGAGKRMRASG